MRWRGEGFFPSCLFSARCAFVCMFVHPTSLNSLKSTAALKHRISFFSGRNAFLSVYMNPDETTCFYSSGHTYVRARSRGGVDGARRLTTSMTADRRSRNSCLSISCLPSTSPFNANTHTCFCSLPLICHPRDRSNSPSLSENERKAKHDHPEWVSGLTHSSTPSAAAAP